MIAEIYRRVARWNAARYEREFNLALAVKLLREEYQETLEAKEDVNKLDGLCDLQYVALGVLWKCRIEEQNLSTDEETRIAYSIIQSMQTIGFEPVHCIGSVLDSVEHDRDMPVILAMYCIIIATQAQMQRMDLTELQAHHAMLAVCNANDTKKVVKVASDVKANDKDKGEDFMPPEHALQAILDMRGVPCH